MSKTPYSQAPGKHSTPRFKSLWDAIQSKTNFTTPTDDRDAITFFSRLALWLYCLGAMISPLLSLVQPEPLATIYLKYMFLIMTPGVLLAIALSCSEEKVKILLANFTVHSSILVAHLATLPPTVTYGSDTNYFIFLPLIAMCNLPLLFLWTEYPKSILVFVIMHASMIAGSSMTFDPNWSRQLGAFYVFFGVIFCIILFTIVFRKMVISLRNSMMQARASAIEAATKDKMLNLAVEVNFPALIFFDPLGHLIEKRGEIAHQLLVSDAFGAPLNLTSFLQHFRDQFGVDLSTRNDSSQEIFLNGRHFLISRRDLIDIVAFAFIDITERIKQTEQLHESQKLGIIGEITSGIAHDYNNLLAIMLANLEAIPEQQSQDIWSPYLASIYKSIDQAKIISAKLLTIAGKREFTLKTVSVGQVIDDISLLLRTAVGDEVSLIIKCEDGLFIATDAGELGSAVLNLVVNARNAISHNAGQISVSVYEQNNNVIIEVLDNGKGISEQHRHKIFDPFYTTKNRQNSTGLGLSLVQSFVKQCGGNIQLQSHFGETRFRLRFPRVAPPAPEITVLSTPQCRSRDERYQRLLLVDDNVNLARSMSMLLSGKGFDCVAKYSPADAIETVTKDDGFTAVILDLSMPDQNGIELSQSLMPLLPQAAFILLTGDIDDATESIALQAGFNAVLLKPIKVEKLIETLNAFTHDDRPLLSASVGEEAPLRGGYGTAL